MLALLFLAFLLLLVVGFDVGFSMVLAAFLGVQFKTERLVDTTMLPLSMINGVDSYALVQIPLFILAGELMNRGGLTQRLIDWSQAMVGQVRGSLGHVSIITNFIMAGVSGSAVADAVATGKPLIPAMQRAGYGDGYAGAVIAAGALLGPIIPPSIPMVIYAQIASQSVVKMFMSVVVPGILLAAGYLVLCTIIGRVRSYPRPAPVSWGQRLQVTRSAGWALLMPLIVIFGIRFGLVTDTEAAALAALYALVVSFFIYRSLSFMELGPLLTTAGKSAGVILFLVAAAGPFSWLVAESQVNERAIGLLHGISDNPTVILRCVNAFLLLVGCILEPLPAMIIFVPTLLPLAAQLGIDPIQFGAVIVLNLMIGLLHPPIGLLLFVVANVGKLPIKQVVMDSLPFLAWSILVLILAIIYPPITTWLPNQLY